MTQIKTSLIATINQDLADHVVLVPPSIATLFGGDRCTLTKCNNAHHYITVKPFPCLSEDNFIQVSSHIALTLGLDANRIGDVVFIHSEVPNIPSFLYDQNSAVAKVVAEKPEFKTYHRDRTAFATTPRGDIVFNKGDMRCHHDWMMNDYGISESDYEKLIRGCIYKDYVQFYVGKEHGPVLDHDKICSIVTHHDLMYGENGTRRKIYDGLHIGELGVFWEPMYEVVL